MDNKYQQKIMALFVLFNVEKDPLFFKVSPVKEFVSPQEHTLI